MAARNSILFFPALVALGVIAGCPSPDVDGKLESFEDKTQDIRDEASIEPDVGGGSLADVTGTFHFSLAAVLQPTTPLQFIAETEFTTDESGGGTISIQLQPLSLTLGATNEPREFVGDIIPLEFAVDDAAAITGEFEMLEVTGAANPITGGNIVAVDVLLSGVIQSEDVYCGTVRGQVTAPTNLDLAGSTFAAVRIDPADAMNPAALPDPPIGACPEGGGRRDRWWRRVRHRRMT